MRLSIIVGSISDIITNSSTEILEIKTTETIEVLRELILNFMMGHDRYASVYGVDPNNDLTISKHRDIKDELLEVYGEVSEDEYKRFNELLCKKYGLDPDAPGEIYMIDIEEHMNDTIEFLKTKLGAV